MPLITLPTGWQAIKTKDKFFYFNLESRVFSLSIPFTVEQVPVLSKSEQFRNYFFEIESALRENNLESLLCFQKQKITEEVLQNLSMDTGLEIEKDLDTTNLVSQIDEARYARPMKEQIQDSFFEPQISIDLSFEKTLKLADEEEILENLMTLKFSPTSLIQVMKEKDKVFVKESYVNDPKADLRLITTMDKVFIIMDTKKNKQYIGKNKNKTKAKHIACLKLLKDLFPHCSTYGEIINEFLVKKMIKIK